MKITDLSSKIRQMPSTHSVAMIALRLIGGMNHNTLHVRLDEWLQANREVLDEVLRRVLQPLIFKQNASTKSGYYNIVCADGNFRRFKPVLAAWLADYPEYSDLHYIQQHVGFW